MSESPAAIGAERVFIRHAKDKFRGDIYRLSDAVKAPFPTSSGSSCASAVNVRASGRWLLGVQTADHAWVALFSNAASGPEIFKTLAASRNLDAVCVGYDPQRGWTFQYSRASTPTSFTEVRLSKSRWTAEMCSMGTCDKRSTVRTSLSAPIQ